MSGIEQRRNQWRFWAGEVTWTRLRRKQLPPCDDCVVLAYDLSMRPLAADHAGRAAGEDRPRVGKAGWRRICEATGEETNLCDPHKRAWEGWTPGQLDLLGGAR